MTCARCGFAEAEGSVCSRCGVVFAKLAAARPRPAPRANVPAPETASAKGLHGLGFLALGVATLGAIAFIVVRQRPAPTPTDAPKPIPAPAAVAAPQPQDLPPPPPVIPAAPPPITEVEAGRIADEDAVLAEELGARVRAGSSVSAADLRSAETLNARYPDEPGLRSLLGATLVVLGRTEILQRRYGDAASHFRRAAEVQPGEIAPRLGLLATFLAEGNWTGAESAAREALSLDGNNSEALEGLAFALFRQDRNREAADVLRTSLAIRETPQARAIMDRIEKAQADEEGMKEQRISHFHVRYDGDSHDEVGRAILRSLERHYATLVGALDYQPQATIPVILFSREQYYDASGAPSWSGGVYDNVDGRIRIPIGGLTASLTPDIDGVLIHEVTHAFIADRSRGLAPREIHEGLAQYMEGKRIASLLDAEQLKGLADGRGRGVYAFYMQALSLVEYLMSVRGQGGMNDLLKVMGQTGDVNEAFRRVYGQDYPGTQRAWTARFRQQYGS
jgi:tetratricopeptide (TPR) repeat protein